MIITDDAVSTTAAARAAAGGDEDAADGSCHGRLETVATVTTQ